MIPGHIGVQFRQIQMRKGEISDSDGGFFCVSLAPVGMMNNVAEIIDFFTRKLHLQDAAIANDFLLILQNDDVSAKAIIHVTLQISVNPGFCTIR